MADWLAQRCRAMGFEVKLQECAPGRPNVIATWPGASGKSLLLTGHTDIVSVANMRGDPFDGRIENGRLYGRGALDMKGGLAAILGAVAALKAADFRPAGDLILGFVTDEENHSLGSAALVEAVRADAAILTEPTGLDLCVAHKGFAWLTLETAGRAAHGSLYDRGVDAVAHMGRLLGAMETLDREVLPGRTHRLLGRPSVHAGTIAGGTGVSIYPDGCTLRVEHRLLPDEDGDTALGYWREIIARLSADDPAFQATATLDFYRPGYALAPDAPIAQAVAGAHEAIAARPRRLWE